MPSLRAVPSAEKWTHPMARESSSLPPCVTLFGHY